MSDYYHYLFNGDIEEACKKRCESILDKLYKFYPLVGAGKLAMAITEKPKSKYQKYYKIKK